MNTLDPNVHKKQDAGSIICKDYGLVEWHDWRTCLYKDETAVFRFHCAEGTTMQPNWGTLLHPDEIERGSRYHRKEDRLRSLYTRSLLRILVGKYTHQNPLAIGVTKGAHNKPELAGTLGWHINATHSGNWILLTIGKHSVGIDVEQVNSDFAFADLLPSSFSTAEREYLEADGQTPTRFYELWTRKEAVVKAMGSGIDETFPQVPSLPGFHKTATSQLATGGAWTVDSFYAAQGYPAAIAYSSSSEPVSFYTLDDSIFISPNKQKVD